jgi:hypothetical protein
MLAKYYPRFLRSGRGETYRLFSGKCETSTRASVDYAACFTASINVGSLLSALELLIRLETAHRCK